MYPLVEHLLLLTGWLRCTKVLRVRTLVLPFEIYIFHDFPQKTRVFYTFVPPPFPPSLFQIERSKLHVVPGLPEDNKMTSLPADATFSYSRRQKLRTLFDVAEAMFCYIRVCHVSAAKQHHTETHTS